jgi:hypothetical protein
VIGDGRNDICDLNHLYMKVTEETVIKAFLKNGRHSGRIGIRTVQSGMGEHLARRFFVLQHMRRYTLYTIWKRMHMR